MTTSLLPKQLILVVSVLAIISQASCSHRTPYLRDEVTSADSQRPDDAVVSRIILVGDAGETNAPVLADVASRADEYPDRTIVLFLGDNFYPEGMTPERAGEADARLLPQIEAATSGGARALFVPGNHDWGDGEAGGYEAILAQADYIDAHVPHPDSFLPEGGCPGPNAVDTFAGVRIIAVDTQWWLHEHDKPTESCPTTDPMRFAQALSDLMETDRAVVFAAHHPLLGFGRHNGFSEWREHLLPPIVGTAIALTRKLAPRSQDYNSEPYRTMTDLFRSAIAPRNEPDSLVIWAAGHDHSLQVMEGQAADYVLISGSAAHTTPVGHGPATLFAHSRPGFMVIDLLESGEAWLRVIEPDLGGVFERRLDPAQAAKRSRPIF